MNAKASLDLAEAEFARIKSLLDQKVVSQSEDDQRGAGRRGAAAVPDGAERRAAVVSIARGGARAGRCSRARRRPIRPSARRSPAIVAERVVSVGDYVTRGAHVATIVRVDPMRIELTVPEQSVSLIKDGQPVQVAVDAYPGETFPATVRYVSPSLRADQRALTVEAVAPNPDGRLKPGLFATALIQQPASTPALLVPASAVETVAGTSRVYVVKGDKVEERIVTLGETVGEQVEITSGLQRATSSPRAEGQLADGTAVRTLSRFPISYADCSFRRDISCSGSQRFPSSVRSLPASSSCR